jgi:hypothetical protein
MELLKLSSKKDNLKVIEHFDKYLLNILILKLSLPRLSENLKSKIFI